MSKGVAILVAVPRLLLGGFVFLLTVVIFGTASLGQVIGPLTDIPVQITEFYRSANQREIKHKLSLPSAIAIARSGNVYVFDDGNSRIVKLDKNGQFLKEFGFSGTGASHVSPGGLNDVLAVDGAENLYVADTVRSKVQIFNPNGEFVSSFRVPFLIEGLAVNSLGEIFVSVTSSKRIPLIYVFSNSGKLVRSFGERIVSGSGGLPKQVNRTVIAIDTQENLFVTFRHWPIIRKYSRNGRLLGESTFTVPSELVPESQRERYSLSFISNHPETEYSLPLLTHSISLNRKGEAYLLLNGHSVVKFNRAVQVVRENHLQIPNLSRDATFVRLAAATEQNEIYLLDIRFASIYKARGL